MWNPDEEKNKHLLSKEALASIQHQVLEILPEYQIFKFNFLESSLVRKAHGFDKNKEGKIVLIDRTWVDSTIDHQKKEWIRQIFKEVNGIGDKDEMGLKKNEVQRKED